MARVARVEIRSDITGAEIEENDVATIEIRLPDGKVLVGELSSAEAKDLGSNFREKRKRASGRPRNPDGSFVKVVK